MGGLFKIITSLLIALGLSTGVTSMSEVTPQEATDAFLKDLSGGDQQIAMAYMDNRYVNFIENVKGTDEEMDRLEEALFRNFSYEIEETAEKNDVAVAKVLIKNSDFSGIIDDYEKVSYEYVTDNLYSEEVTSKEKLNKHCLDIYLDQIEKTAKKDPTYEAEVFIPMHDDGYGGWRIILNDDIMKAVLGELEIPTND